MRIIKYLVPALVLLLAGCEGEKNAFFIEESGTIETNNVIISTRTGGEIVALYADDGEQIEANRILALIDTTTYHLQLMQAKAALESASATYSLISKGARAEDKTQAKEMYNQAKENFDMASSDKERFENLFAKKAVTKKQLDDIQARFNIAQSQLNAAEANYTKVKNIARPEEIQQSKANLDRAEATYNIALKNLNDCTIKSPINGFIVKSFIEKNETVAPLSSLFKVADLSVAELAIYVSEKDLPKIKLGQKAEVKIDAFENKTYEGTVTYISPEAEFTPKNIQSKDERTKLVFEVKITIPNPEYELKPGLPADAKVFINGK